MSAHSSLRGTLYSDQHASETEQVARTTGLALVTPKFIKKKLAVPGNLGKTYIGLHLIYLLFEIVLLLGLLIEELTAPIFETFKLFHRVLVVAAG